MWKGSSRTGSRLFHCLGCVFSSSPQGYIRHSCACKTYIFLPFPQAHAYSPSRLVCMSEDVSSFEVHPRQGAFRMAGGSLLAIALLPSCSSDEACTNTHQLQQSTCADAHSWAHVDSHAQSGAVGDKGATIFNETGVGCEATYLLASLWSWAYHKPKRDLTRS